jgi:hypothetical protein
MPSGYTKPGIHLTKLENSRNGLLMREQVPLAKGAPLRVPLRKRHNNVMRRPSPIPGGLFPESALAASGILSSSDSGGERAPSYL